MIKRKAVKKVDPKGVELPRGNPTLKVVRKVSTDELPRRCSSIYSRLSKSPATLAAVAGDNRHKRWSVRILLKMKLVEAVPEPESKEKPSAKKAVAKTKRRAKPGKKASAKPAEQKPEPKPPVA